MKKFILISIFIMIVCTIIGGVVFANLSKNNIEDISVADEQKVDVIDEKEENISEENQIDSQIENTENEIVVEEMSDINVATVETPEQQKYQEKAITTTNNSVSTIKTTTQKPQTQTQSQTQSQEQQNNKASQICEPKATTTTQTVTNNKNASQTTTVNQSNQSKIDLSKYSFYEKLADGSYKGFIPDQAEINKLKSLIDSSISNFGYKNTKIVLDSSLAKNGAKYFTANKTNVDNIVYNSEGFSICYYAVKEYLISTDGTEKYFQTRSYLKVK